MYWTEEEAKEKWCPNAFVYFNGGNSNTGSSKRACIASACMMWRDETGTPEGMPRKGYCGLAGKP